MEEGGVGKYWSMHIICLYENKIIKLVEITFSRGDGNKRENDGGDEPNQSTFKAYMEMSH
jgi:hypothetical protein